MTSCPSLSVYMDTWPQKEARHLSNSLGKNQHICLSPRTQGHGGASCSLGNCTSWPKRTESRWQREIGWPWHKTHPTHIWAQLDWGPVELILRHFWGKEKHSSIQWQDANTAISLENNNHSLKDYHLYISLQFPGRFYFSISFDRSY